MKTKYILNDWSAVSQMINEEDPKIKVNYHIDPETRVESIAITCQDEAYPLSRVLAKVNVESGGVWSLSNEKVVEMLNAYGFSCELKKISKEISEDVMLSLTSLKSLGYVSVTRRVSPRGEIRAYKGPDDIEGTGVYTEDYRDWRFLEINVLTSIDKILEGMN